MVSAHPPCLLKRGIWSFFSCTRLVSDRFYLGAKSILEKDDETYVGALPKDKFSEYSVVNPRVSF